MLALAAARAAAVCAVVPPGGGGMLIRSLSAKAAQKQMRALSTAPMPAAGPTPPFGNANAFWFVGAGLSTYFFGTTPRKLEGKQMSTAFKVHLACACTTTYVCLWNLCFSPSQGPIRAMLHSGVGRLGMVTSLVGLGCGYVAAWYDEGVPRGTAIGLSCVGVLQLFYTVTGFRQIRAAQLATGELRKQLINQHIRSMNVLYYGACLGPAWFRVPEWAMAALDKDPHELPQGLMFVGLVPAFLLPGKGVSAVLRKRFF